MSCLYYRDTELYIENINVKHLAEEFGTPCYLYSRTTIEKNWRAFDDAFAETPHRICYAVKANSNLAILHLLAKLNSGFDIVSLGELERVLAAQGDPKKIIFSGVGKTEAELEQAIKKGIYCFNIESAPELDRLHFLTTRLNKKINVALRVNPNIDPDTHAHIATGLKENKFGIEMDQVIPLCQRLKSLPALNLIGIGCHIGSQIVKLEPFIKALDCLLSLYKTLQTQHISVQHLDIGGGLGIVYHDEKPPSIQEYVNVIKEKLAGYPLEIILEPGRSLIANAGVLITKIEYLKHTKEKNFAIVDAGMNDLLRPALYNAWQPILPVERHSGRKIMYDIAGPVCESADILGKNRELHLRVGDYLAIDCVGAYGSSMSSNYNARCRPVEILITDREARVIRRRETIPELFALEVI